MDEIGGVLKGQTYSFKIKKNGDVIYSRGNIVNTIVTVLYSGDSNKTYCGDNVILSANIKSLSHTPEINSILYVNYSSIRKNSCTRKIINDISLWAEFSDTTSLAR